MSQQAIINGNGSQQGQTEPNDWWRKAIQYLAQYLAALVLTGTAVPILAAGLAAVFYIVSTPTMLKSPNVNPLILASVIMIIIWLIVAIPVSALATAKRSRSHTYGLLKNQLSQLEIYLSPASGKNPDSTTPKDAALAEMNKCYDDIKRELNKVGLLWMLFTGYVTVWYIIHRAQEAFMEFESKDSVIREALGDMLRIKGSKMPKEDDLLQIMGQAVNVLNPDVMPFFINAPKPPTQSAQIKVSPMSLDFGTLKKSTSRDLTLQIGNSGGQLLTWNADRGGAKWLTLDTSTGTVQPNTQHTIKVTVDTTNLDDGPESVPLKFSSNGGNTEVEVKLVVATSSQNPATPPAPPPANSQSSLNEVQAQAVLRQIRNALNQFKDDRYNGLVRSRNLLLATITITGLVTYLLIAIAIANEATVPSVVAAATFYAVGAVAGLFAWLYRGAKIDKIDTRIDDFGLTQARLIATPLLSGLAGVGGILITVMLYSSLLLPQTAPMTPPAATPTMMTRSGQTASSTLIASPSPALTPSPSSTMTPTPSPTMTPSPTPSANPAQTPLLCSAIGPNARCATVNDIFYLDPRYLVTAALFGLVPTLIIGTLLQRSQQYISDLNSVKPSEDGVF